MRVDARQELLLQTARIVSAFVSRHPCNADDLAGLVVLVRQALAELQDRPRSSVSTTIEPAARPEPAVPIKRSVFPDHIVCLEDGKRLKTLKRHLARAYGLTPEQYRQRWGLPSSYPMVAPDYAGIRSRLAREIGLGRRRSAAETVG